MYTGQPSRTMLRTAIRRATHQLVDRPLILDDPVVVELIPEAADRVTLANLDNHLIDPALFRALFAMRSRFAEDRLAAAAARGVRQYVIVSAGLDTFPWRQPDFAREMQIFAADHPDSLAWTRARFRERRFSPPPNLIDVPIDLEKESLAAQLGTYGFSPMIPTFCSALGIIQYLSAETVDSLLVFAASLPEGSEFVASFVPPDSELAGDDREAAIWSVARAAGLGEPWKTRLRQDDLSNRLRTLGFSQVFHLTPELAQQFYFTGRHDSLRAPRWEQMIAAIL
jgi:methyltransferase (TIGR00027 family)